ncbi:J domain-containing protein [Cyanobium sp. BA5m-10]|uniref:J domain-containing protein n=1 Tax=Cyanobium sp. BA5m-10 TaxID=2823705 RepID=UPI0020CEBBBB|nr:J domain-containing protein [Cyanobium sp. BA5m-10]MCP9903542.1 J domain-containing protein [Cyanobium sp. BA5m-10]
MSDHYRILGVQRNASFDEIKRAYRAKAKLHHPDAGGDGIQILGINNAWEVLGNTDKRRAYDLTSNPVKNTYQSTRGQAGSGSRTNHKSSEWADQARRTRHDAETHAYAAKNVEKQVFKKICICGCNGYPLTHLSAYSINYELYVSCPARKLRKKIGFYYDRDGNLISWDAAKTRRWQARQQSKGESPQIKKGREQAKRKKEKELKEQQRAREEQGRVENRMPPINPSEARRRGLNYYAGSACKYGHASLRDLKGNCLKCRELEKMKRQSEKRSSQATSGKT